MCYPKLWVPHCTCGKPSGGSSPRPAGTSTAHRLCSRRRRLSASAHALIEKQASCQRVQRLLLSSNLLECNEIGEAVSSNKRRCAKSTAPAGGHPANILAPPAAGLVDKQGNDGQPYWLSFVFKRATS